MVYSAVAYQRKGRVTGSVVLNPSVTAGEPSGPQGSDYRRNRLAQRYGGGIWQWLIQVPKANTNHLQLREELSLTIYSIIKVTFYLKRYNLFLLQFESTIRFN